jgi:hypothetical protein
MPQNIKVSKEFRVTRLGTGALVNVEMGVDDLRFKGDARQDEEDLAASYSTTKQGNDRQRRLEGVGIVAGLSIRP